MVHALRFVSLRSYVLCQFRDRLVDERGFEPALSEVDITFVDGFDAPRNDATGLRRTAIDPRVVRNSDEAVVPGSGREGEDDLLLALKRV